MLPPAVLGPKGVQPLAKGIAPTAPGPKGIALGPKGIVPKETAQQPTSPTAGVPTAIDRWVRGAAARASAAAALADRVLDREDRGAPALVAADSVLVDLVRVDLVRVGPTASGPNEIGPMLGRKPNQFVHAARFVTPAASLVIQPTAGRLRNLPAVVLFLGNACSTARVSSPPADSPPAAR